MENVNRKLFHACQKGSINEIEVALSEGADIDAFDNLGYTPLLIAVFFFQIKAVEYLCEKGANVNLCKKGAYTPLDMAYMYCEDAIKVLRKNGAKRYDELYGSK